MVELHALIRAFQSGDESAFSALNLRWIEEYFGVEDKDRRQLEDPHSEILDRGGYIAIAELEGVIVGTGALIPASHPPDGYEGWGEIVKMATAPMAQGAGVGGDILDHLIEQAQIKKMQGLWLETNDQLEAATLLYKRKGFVELSKDQQWETPYTRCNLQMTLRLGA